MAITLSEWQPELIAAATEVARLGGLGDYEKFQEQLEQRQQESFWDHVFKEDQLQAMQDRQYQGHLQKLAEMESAAGMQEDRDIRHSELRTEEKNRALQMAEEADDRQYTKQQRRQIEEINNQMQRVADALSSGELTDVQADDFMYKLQAKKANVKPMTMPKQQRATPVFSQDGKWIQKGNGDWDRVENRNEPPAFKVSDDGKFFWDGKSWKERKEASGAGENLRDVPYKDRFAMIEKAYKYLNSQKDPMTDGIKPFSHQDAVALAEKWLGGQSLKTIGFTSEDMPEEQYGTEGQRLAGITEPLDSETKPVTPEETGKPTPKKKGTKAAPIEAPERITMSDIPQAFRTSVEAMVTKAADDMRNALKAYGRNSTEYRAARKAAQMLRRQIELLIEQQQQKK